MVTKQEQLEWLADRYESWPIVDGYVAMSGYCLGGGGGSHYITKEEWQQERDKMQKQDVKVMNENEFEDELEKMYWDFDAERAKKSKCERLNFKMFMRMASGLTVERKQDNSWHERGELPPVGAICEMIDDKNTWIECEIISHKDGACIGWVPSRKAPFYTYDKSEFRPLRTEREKAIEEMASILAGCEKYAITQNLAMAASELLYDAGFHK